MALYEVSYEFPIGSANRIRRNVEAATEQEARVRAGVQNPTLEIKLASTPIYTQERKPAAYRVVDRIGVCHNFEDGSVGVSYEESAELFWVLGLWASGDLKMDLEACADSDMKARDMYCSLSGGREPVAYRGNANKWGIEAALHFSTDYSLPRCFAEHQIERPGLISRVQLFNMLIGMGFRAGESHDVAEIRKRVPPKYIENFEHGFTVNQPTFF